MSHVTNVLVAIGVANWGDGDTDAPAMVRMNELLQASTGQQLKCVNHAAGGSKHLEIDVWAGALNYAPVHVIVESAINAGWSDTSQVQLMICDQWDDLFTVRTVAEWSMHLSSLRGVI